MQRIHVTKTFMPPFEDYEPYLRQLWDTAFLTNQGPLLQTFEQRAKDYLAVPNFQFVGNGTIALQLALRALDITGEVITTPFSYVATTSSIMWERCTPVFVDIEPDSLCMDVAKVEAAITDKTQAIMPVHVFGFPCDVEKIEQLARKHNLKVIYDAAHAFGVEYKGTSLLNFGDVSTCSFHSTKLFHTIEGGCIVTSDPLLNQKIDLMKRFGHNGDEHLTLGINAKANEFQAAMGLANLKYVDSNIEKRRQVSEWYDELLDGSVRKPRPKVDYKPNHGYYPVIFQTEEHLLEVMGRLADSGIYPRRYFYPSLNSLWYVPPRQSCPISEDIAKRIACLPLYVGLEKQTVVRICEIINA